MKLLPPADAYVFDIDGTLLVTTDLVHWNALHRAMIEAYGVDATIDGIPYHGMTDISILRTALARADVSGGAFESSLPMALEVVCREVESNRKQIAPHVCAGVPALLTKLHQQRTLLGVASGNLETVGWHKIEAAGLRDYFSFGFFSDHCERRADIFRNAIDHAASILGTKARVCFVGDTPSDVQAAKEVGGLIVAVATGTFARDELNALSPDLCLSHCDELFVSD
jgi:phosphoglycolate phosphatase-like HAD superfamily hydrolase